MSAGIGQYVVAHAAEYDIDGAALRGAVEASASEGTDRHKIFHRALEHPGRTDVPAFALSETFRRFSPDQLSPHDGVAAGLESLRTRVPLGW